ncbi:hypothetical protein NDU88_005588 [Pleurodeles waltl]|uniref:Uncharacterized protein n=1 Tax=Pleurodeles waltl TaxID=8319 RepID=A0AAV7PGD2_PLEWA|nr:hypothetical protein NDU88_005588 [Pleurodeles waltl]
MVVPRPIRWWRVDCLSQSLRCGRTGTTSASPRRVLGLPSVRGEGWQPEEERAPPHGFRLFFHRGSSDRGRSLLFRRKPPVHGEQPTKTDSHLRSGPRVWMRPGRTKCYHTLSRRAAQRWRTAALKVS